MAMVRVRPFSTAVDPFREVSDVQSELNRFFDSFFGRPPQAGGMERVWAPAIDMYETKGD